MAKNKDKIENAGVEVPYGYVTLKEASEKTEYTPDYIGQLIRAGKIEGKQVYSNVAWVANEASLCAYLESKGKNHDMVALSVVPGELPHLVRPLLYLVIVCAALFLVILLHVLSVTIDKAIAKTFQDDPGTTTIEVTGESVFDTRS
jgi:hypothetical protein